MANQKITVACKLPNGLECEVADIEFEDIQGNKVAKKSNIRTFWLRGSAEARAGDTNTMFGTHPRVIGGYGLCEVDKELWDKWYSNNFNDRYKFPPLTNGLIFAVSTPARAAAQAKEQAEIRSGLEPIKPTEWDANGRPIGEVDPRMGPNIATESESAKQRREQLGG